MLSTENFIYDLFNSLYSFNSVPFWFSSLYPPFILFMGILSLFFICPCKRCMILITCILITCKWNYAIDRILFHTLFTQCYVFILIHDAANTQNLLILKQDRFLWNTFFISHLSILSWECFQHLAMADNTPVNMFMHIFVEDRILRWPSMPLCKSLPLEYGQDLWTWWDFTPVVRLHYQAEGTIFA